MQFNYTALSTSSSPPSDDVDPQEVLLEYTSLGTCIPILNVLEEDCACPGPCPGTWR